MYRGQPYLNGPRHTYLDMVVKDVSPRVLGRIMDGLMHRSILYRNLEPPFLTMKYAIPLCYRGQIDNTKAREAFGRRAMPKLVRELQNPCEEIMCRALNTLADNMHDPEKVFEALNLRIFDRIADKLCNEDPFVRERVSDILASIARHALGREQILRKPERLDDIGVLLTDLVPTVRLNAALAVESLAMNLSYGFCDGWLLSALIGQLATEDNMELLAIHLRSLKFVLGRKNQEAALKTCIMDLLMEIFDHPDPAIQGGAMGCIAILTMHPKGMQMAENMDILHKVRPKIYSDIYDIHYNAVSIIAYNTLTKQSKYLALSLDILDRLFLLAADEKHPELQVSSIKALINIAETPEGRKKMLNHLEEIDAIRTNGNEFVEMVKEKFLKVTFWKS